MYFRAPFFPISFSISFLLFLSIQWVSSSYPLYCSKHNSENTITPLTLSTEEEIALGNLTLRQVQILIRHGSRTPASARKCWNGYNETWTCHVHENMIPGIVRKDTLTYTKQYLFEKVYRDEEEELPGDCLLGQLLDEGYAQELNNGINFRKAYLESKQYPLFDKAEVPLLDLSNTSDFYFEGSDLQRTTISGQLVVMSMFSHNNTNVTPPSTVIPWHITDYTMSRFYPNAKICPVLKEIEHQWITSKPFQEWNNSKEVQKLHSDLSGSISNFDMYGLFDCVMTTVCNDRNLPKVFSEDVLQRYIRYFNTYSAKQFTFNNSAYSKLTISSLMKEVKNRLIQKIRTSSIAPRFVLYSGHDTTLLPFLAAIGGDRWIQDGSSYASHIAIELYKSEKTDEHYVRLLFQGKELRIPSCENALCPLPIFLSRISFADFDFQLRCHNKKNDVMLALKHAFNGMNASDMLLYVLPFFFLLIGIVLGMFVKGYMDSPKKTNIIFPKKKEKEEDEDEDEEEDMSEEPQENKDKIEIQKLLNKEKRG